jgi:hypothetical protein
MGWLHIIALLAGGALACSNLILAKKPDAKQMLDKLMPFQAFIGLATLVLGVLAFLQLGPSWFGQALKHAPVIGIAYLGAIIGGAALGLVFAMPLISKWTGKDGSAVVQKLAPFQVILGLICLGSGALLLLFVLGILKFV